MNWDKVRQTVGKLAPLVGAAINPALGGVVGTLVANALGVEDKPEAIAAAIERDPHAALKLKALEQRHHIQLEQIALERDKAVLQDVQQARSVHKDHWMPSVLTGVLAVMVCGLVYVLIRHAVPDENRDILVYAAGQITTAFSTAVAFWLGSSRSSQQKDKMMRG